MAAWLLMAMGVLLNCIGMALLFKDCYRDYGSTMGGEMLAGFLWTLGAIFGAAGIYFVSGASLPWALLSFIWIVLFGLPCRQALIRLGMKYGKPSPRHRNSGFAGHVANERALGKKKQYK